MNTKAGKYFSDSYISYATGETRIILSRISKHNNNKYILCLDISSSLKKQRLKRLPEYNLCKKVTIIA